MSLKTEQADEIYDVLVKHAGAGQAGYDRDYFVRAQASEHITEFRFIGALGFGGKFWRNGGWYVTCYREDETPERLAMIRATNEALALLKERHEDAE